MAQSNLWQTYKIVDFSKLNQYQKNVLDSLQKSKSEQINKQQVLDNQSVEISSLKEKIVQLEENLKDAQTQNDSINFFGMWLSKTSYAILMWGIIAFLAFFLFVYVYRYSNRKAVTKKAVKDLNDLQEEYENYRKSAIEREQKVRRQLQDEINKHR